MPNRLKDSTSPYLLQHADNPVDWYEWSEEAFERAKQEDKPIFLSIGYSTCHWCHVMAHESFEDSEVAKLMNAAFVNIKVDREERPDIDSLYMNVCQIMTGQGGWPLTIIMTPEKKPFFAGTYFPKESRFGRIGMMELIPQIQQAWKEQREKIEQSSMSLMSAVEQQSAQRGGEEELTVSELTQTFQELSERFDHEHGGFGEAPKFPTPHQLLFLLRYWKRTGEEQALFMAEQTLTKMRLGGIFDQLGFGFHRYSVDQEWLVPHFEKMLYDQALLIMAYTEAYQVTKKDFYKRTAEEIITYVLRDGRSPEGGFYCGEDADSEGVEGKFYVWPEEKIKKILGEKDARWFSRQMNVSAEGNYIEEATRSRNGTNILHFKKLPKNQKRFEQLRKKLFKQREQRVRPHRDDKILTDWNGLMIAALSKAGWAFDEKKYTEAAEKAARFILESLRDDQDRLQALLQHSWRKGRVGVKTAFLDDYAFFIWGLIELYESTFNPCYLETALDFNQHLLDQFWDDDGGGFFFSAKDDKELFASQKESYDSALPSGNSVAMLNLLRLAKMTGRTELEEKALRVGKSFTSLVWSHPSAHTMLMCSLDFALGPRQEIVVVGSSSQRETKKMIDELRTWYLPRSVVLFRNPEDQEDPLVEISPWTKDLKCIGKKSTTYICENYQCLQPVTSPKSLASLLKNR